MVARCPILRLISGESIHAICILSVISDGQECENEMEKHPVVQSFRDLLVWQRSIQLASAIYQLSRDFPPEELYGLTSQMRRAAVSIASNIAEGQGRLSTGEFKQFLGMARGSSFEL